jgi:subtilase family serine protease
MQRSEQGCRRPFFRACMLVVVSLLAVSNQLLSQELSFPVVVSPPLRTKGNAQPGVVGLTPNQVRHAYGFDLISNQGAGQTIAVIEAFGDPSIEKDLEKFDERFGLPPCTTSNGCLQVLSSNGKNQGTSQIWSLETALDVEWAHAIAPQASIMVVESPSDILNGMLQAVDFAVSHGATVVSMSWGGSEFPGENALDSHFLASNVSFVASSGDFGTGVIYPAVSPYVLSVGGTTLGITDSLGTYGGEVAWSESGGGQAAFEPERAYQKNFPIPLNFAGLRGNPDVAYDADPNTGFAVFTTVSFKGFNGWIQVGGTSAGPPQWAALIAIAKSMGWSPAPLTGTNTGIYSAASKPKSYAQNYNDVTGGSNGTCGLLCTAARGYDYVTGLGSPRVQNLVNVLIAR